MNPAHPAHMFLQRRLLLSVTSSHQILCHCQQAFFMNRHLAKVALIWSSVDSRCVRFHYTIPPSSSSPTAITRTAALRHKEIVNQRPSSGGQAVSSAILSSPALAERFVTFLPIGLQPYARLLRLDRPIGTWLLLWPCWWSVALATPAGHLPSLLTLGYFATGAVMMRGAGCIINDLWDRNFDRQVERTKARPLASKEVEVADSIAFLAGVMGVGLLVLLQFDLRSILLGASSLGLVVTYPAFKRFTYWPQVVLGLAFNWGALLGWSVVHGGDLQLSAVLPLYTAGIIWTLFYDTIYAHQDRLEDIKLGLKSTAIKFGQETDKWLAGFTAAMTASLMVTGVMTEQVWPYYLSVAGVAGNLWRIKKQVDIDSRETCHRGFVKNNQVGWMLFVGIVASTLLKKKKKSEDENGDDQHNRNKEVS